jgi:hypothetical protein
VAEGSRYFATTNDWNACAVALRIGEVDGICDFLYLQEDGTLGVTDVYKTPAQWRNIHAHGFRIIPCTTYRIQAETCYGSLTLEEFVTTWAWGDLNGDGIVDVSDVLLVLDAFAAPSGTPLYHADLLPCLPGPDGMVDVGDILAVLGAFAGNPFPCANPCGTSNACGSGMAPEGGAGAPGGGEGMMGPGGEGGEGPMGGGGSENVIVLAPPSSTVSQGGTVSIEVLIEGPLDLRAYEAAVDISGGSAGSLTLTSLTVNPARPDFVFYGADPAALTPANLAERRLAGALWSGGVSVAAAPKYAGTFTFQASKNAAGTFQITLRTANCSLRDSGSQTLPWSAGAPVTITID